MGYPGLHVILLPKLKPKAERTVDRLIGYQCPTILRRIDWYVCSIAQIRSNQYYIYVKVW